MTAVFPKRTPPLRSDRETVMIGILKGKGPLNAEITVQGAGGPQKLAFTVPPSTSDDSNHYLVPLVEQARADGGLTMPLLGAASLGEARQTVDASVRDLCKLAQQAMAAGSLSNAEKIVGEALRRDPNDTDALAIKSALAKRQSAAPPAAAGAAAPPAPAGTAAPASAKAAPLPPPRPPPQPIPLPAAVT